MSNMFSPSSLRKALAVGFIVLTPSIYAENFQKHVVMQKDLSVQGNFDANELKANKAVVTDVNAKTLTAEDVKVTDQLIIEPLGQGDGCCKSISGIIVDFDPHRDLLAIDFCQGSICPTDASSNLGLQGAIVNLSFCTTCTPANAENSNIDVYEQNEIAENCNACPGSTITLLVDKLYVHPAISLVTNKFHHFIDEKPFHINADKVNDDVPHCCELKVYVNQNPLLTTRMLVGFVQYDSDEDTLDPNNNRIIIPSEFFKKQTCRVFSPGCLFYEVKSCNLFDVTSTTTDATAFETLPADIQALIVGVTSDPKLQEALALEVLSIGQEFIALLQSLTPAVATTVLQQLLADITKGRSVMSNKLKANAKNQKRLLTTLRNLSPALRSIELKPEAKKEEQKETKKENKKKAKCASCGKKGS